MKHRSLKRIISVLLAAVLVLGMICGCSGKGGDQTGTEDGGGGSRQDGSTQDGGAQAMGRFQENEVDTGVVFRNIYDMKKLKDGTIRIIGSNNDDGERSVWDSRDDGKTWEKAYDLPAELQNQDNGYISVAALSPDGQAVCAFNENADGEINTSLYLIDKDGKAGRISFELPEAEGESDGFAVRTTQADGTEHSENNDFNVTSNTVWNLQFPDNDQIVLRDTAGTVYQVGVSDGKVKHTYELDGLNILKVFAVGNTLVMQDINRIILYDMETGEPKSSEAALDKGVDENGVFQAVATMDGGESIYWLSSGGLYHYKFGGSVTEQLIDGSMNTLGVSAFYPTALAMLDEQNLLVAADDPNSDGGRGAVLLKYAYSADTPLKQDKELKVYSLYEDREIRQYINRFQYEHADVSVDYQVALSRYNGVTVSDALKTLTTEIMAGNGPDILLLDGMPVETYIEKGVLKDLSPLLKESGGSYFENIINAYQDEQGQVCAVPAKFLIPMMHADSAFYTPEEDFNAFTARKDTMVNMLPREVVEKFWYTCGAAWQKDDKTLDEAKIMEFLSGLKNAYGEYDIGMEEEPVTLDVGFGSGRDVPETIEQISLSRGDFELAFGIWNTNFGLCESADYGMQQAVNKKLNDGKRDLMPGQADHVFVPFMVMGISSKSEQTEAAEEFVKYVFSREAQKATKLGGFPVEKEAFHSMIDGHENEEGGTIASNDNDKEMLEFLEGYVIAPTPEEEITAMTELVESLKTPALSDDVIKDVVIEQGTKVLKGQISPEEGTAAIMQKVNIYLAE